MESVILVMTSLLFDTPSIPYKESQQRNPAKDNSEETENASLKRQYVPIALLDGLLLLLYGWTLLRLKSQLAHFSLLTSFYSATSF